MGPEQFFKTLGERMDEVVSAMNERVSSCGFPVYTSLDIRDAGWKIAVVDVNLFPAGFNILTPLDRERGARRMREFFSAKLMTTSPWRITVVPEAHTNNAGYLENLQGILGLLKDAGCEVKLMWSGPPIPKAWTVTTRSGGTLEYLPAAEALEGAQALLLNHDLSGGIPAAIKNIALPTFPSTNLGWYRRRKSSHQEIIESLLAQIQRKVDFFDPWYFSSRTTIVSQVNFDTEEGLSAVADKTTEMIAQLKRDYAERGIDETPHVFVKNDAGTYGMGVFSVSDASEIMEGSRKLRNKMRKGKESVPISQVIVQEAVPTALTYRNGNAEIAGEPVLYLVNGTPIGGFIRLHEELGDNARWENLNQPGGKLEPLECPTNQGSSTRPFAKPRGKNPCQQIGAREIYGFLARLHAIGAGLEECPE